LFSKESLAAAGRARIEKQKEIDSAKIEKRRIEALEKLNIKYEHWDKAAKSFGYIGITSLFLLFSIIFGNDLIKLISFYFNEFKLYWKRRKETTKVEGEPKEDNVRIQMELSKKLEQDLEKVYFELVKVNGDNKRKNKNKQPLY
jgi:hypothetical protein